MSILVNEYINTINMAEEEFDPSLLEFVSSAKAAISAENTQQKENKEEQKVERKMEPKKEIGDEIMEVLLGLQNPSNEAHEVMTKGQGEIGGFKADPQLALFFEDINYRLLEAFKKHEERCHLMMNEQLNKIGVPLAPFESLNPVIFFQCMHRVFEQMKGDEEFVKQIRKLDGRVFSGEILNAHFEKLDESFAKFVKKTKEVPEINKQQYDIFKELKQIFNRDEWFDFTIYMECVQKLNKLGDLPKLE